MQINKVGNDKFAFKQVSSISGVCNSETGKNLQRMCLHTERLNNQFLDY